jgi:Ser/Thr protein kinase RdoA (MazF antagonist)
MRDGAVALKRLERRARRGVRRVLALPEQAPLALTRAAGGRAGHAFAVEVEGRKLAVLRAVSRRRRLLRLEEAARRLEALGVRVPRVLWCDPSPLRRWWRGAYLLLEEYLPGQTLAATADRAPVLAQLAGLLARLHSEKRPEWGTFGRRKRRGYARYRLSQAGGALRALRRSGAVEAPEAAAVARRLSAWRRCLEQLDQFHLIHNDLHFANVMVSPQGGVGLIDLYRLRFDRREREIAALLARLEDIDPGKRAVFEEEYWAKTGAPDARLMSLEGALSALARWSSFAGRSRMAQPGREGAGIGRLAALWAERARARIASLD